MLLCSIADVRSRSPSPDIADGPLGALIESVSDDIESCVGEWLAPRPFGPALTTTYLFDVERQGSTLRLVRGGRRTGIRTLTALGIASSSQPETGGSYSTISLADALLRPRPSDEGPASTLTLTSGTFYRGFNTVTVTGSFGPAFVSSRTREATIQLVMLVLGHQPGLATTAERIGEYSVSYGDTTRTLAKQRQDIIDSLSPVLAV